jgi:hypothetical protein
MGQMRNIQIFFAENLEGKKLLAKPICRWEYAIKTCVKEVWCENAEWIRVAEDMLRVLWLDLVNLVMNVQVPYKKGNFVTAEQC